MKTYNCIILDDDEIDQLMTTSFIKRIPSINIVAVCCSADEAFKILDDNHIDILFLDIDMPDTNGLEFRKRAMQIPVCIYISAHSEFAVESFELDTLDFLVKPLKFDRFERAITRINDYFEMKEKVALFESEIGGDTIFIKDGHHQTKIKLHEILYLEALKDYTKIVTENKKHCVLTSLGNLLKEESFKNFIRIHRSYATQKMFVDTIQSFDVILKNKTALPIGRSFKDNLKAFIL
ncbi:response regulator transcription factor [Pedobacter changchengzhani]|uniref:Response regulator transcription factor n=1 Tax=Pedobacter changchengzhani TaxID=2529274 RepID=A0A4R5MJY2_9SPHI|nr:LytTR family DNA-binding domain-containing protein [Pedobacter changchengzhani]TDG35954.1 response regulator transcription factor [Pedobacter changchengzhani]